MTGETSRHMSTPSGGRLLSLFHSCPSPLDGIKIQQTTTKTAACPPLSLSLLIALLLFIYPSLLRETSSNNDYA